MQALAIAIGPAGIRFFAERLVSHELMAAFKTMRPPDKDIPIKDFSMRSAGIEDNFSNIKIQLREGYFSDLTVAYKAIEQKAQGKFPLAMNGSNFLANYKWHESYRQSECTYGRETHCRGWDLTHDFNYTPRIGSLAVQATLEFLYDSAKKSYDIKAVDSSGTSSNVTPNIPGGSVIQNEDAGCFSSSVSSATAAAVAAIDFNTPISTALSGLIKSIPASGQLTQDIVYDFALGDSGLTFPDDNKGIKIGVTGKVRYKTEEFPVPTPAPSVPVPPPPADAHHMQVYVSDYEINALHWAYWRAGLLNTKVTPSDLPDPDVLKVKTYVPMIAVLKPYAAFVMNALAEPVKAPLAAFQEVYEFTKDAMIQLHNKLPADIYNKLLGLEGDGYTSWADVQSELTAAEVPAQYFTPIKDVVKRMGMVATGDVKFTVTIQNGAPNLPNVIFTVARADLLTDLALGQAGKAQTMKYSFSRAKSQAKFVSSTIPNFPGDTFSSIWAVAGEPRYADTLQKMGATGVPIPIMADFQFLFEQAQLSIQQGYVSILANVAFKSSKP